MQLHFALDVIRRGLEQMLPPEVVQKIKLSVAAEHYLMEKGANIETTGAELAREFEASMAAAVEMEAWMTPHAFTRSSVRWRTRTK